MTAPNRSQAPWPRADRQVATPFHNVSYWLADDAVNCEPVSASNSLLTGKNTGNFAKSGHPSQFARPINARSQSLTSQFPTQQNREISNAYQGIFFGEQGNLIEQVSVH